MGCGGEVKARKSRTLIDQAKAAKEPTKALCSLLYAYRDEVRTMEREGIIPVGSAEKCHPVRVLTRLAEDPAVPQAIHLVGMESPGLTAAPAIAAHVAKMVEETMD